MNHPYICPYCFCEYAREKFEEDQQCFCCRAESITSFLLPRTFFLSYTDLPSLAEAKATIASSGRHCRSRKEQIVERIDRLILATPLASDRDPPR